MLLFPHKVKPVFATAVVVLKLNYFSVAFNLKRPPIGKEKRGPLFIAPIIPPVLPKFRGTLVLGMPGYVKHRPPNVRLSLLSRVLLPPSPPSILTDRACSVLATLDPFRVVNLPPRRCNVLIDRCIPVSLSLRSYKCLTVNEGLPCPTSV